MIRWMAILLVACGGAEPEDTETNNTTPPEFSETDTGDTGGYWVTTYADTPTDVTASCWAWAVNHDPDVSGTSLYLYDNSTNLNRTHYETDYEPDGFLDYIVDYAYDGDNIVDYALDWDADGQVDASSEWQYDPISGLRTRFSDDTDGDGLWDEVWTYEYEGDLRTMAMVDEGDDGIIDLWYVYIYDDDDRIQLIVGDRGNDGIPDSFRNYTYADPTTPDVYVEYDADVDGVVDESWDYQYDVNAPDNLLYYEYNNLIGEYSIYNYLWNADGDYTDRWGTVNYDFQDPYDFDAQYTYLAPGRTETIAYDYDFGGGALYSYEQNWTWTCP